jgi:hypothetical protein
MARPERHLPRQAVEDTIVPSLAMVAASTHYKGKAPRIYVPPKPWQVEAYRHFSICGEARFAAYWMANALSRVTLYPVENLSTKKQLTSGPAFDALADLFAGPNGQIQMMQALGLHLTVAGEAYIVGRQVAGLSQDLWEVLAVTEVRANGDTWAITDPEDPTKQDIELGDSDVVIRVWRPDPARRREADSPFKSLLPVLSEIEWLTRHIFAQCASRLAGAGLLFLSDGVEIAEPPSANEDGEAQQFQNKATQFMKALAGAMMRPLSNPESPEALVPVTMTVSEELLKSGGKVAELMHFWTDLDDKALDMRRAAIDRFADGMDIPAEKLRGLSQSAPSAGGGNTSGPNHWGMWQIDEEAIKLHIETMAELVANFLVMGYLRPLEAGDPENAIWYDSSALRLRPDRSKESIELYNLGLVKGSVVLTENRFNPETDMMDDAERKNWLLVKLATGLAASTPEQVQAALSLLGVTLPTTEPTTEETRAPKALPTTENHPTRDIPEAASLLLATCEPLVLRALERAGNRLRQRVRDIGGTEALRALDVRAFEVHTIVKPNGSCAEVLTDAFTGTAEVCLAGIADPKTVVPVLHSYVATLMAEQSPHTRERLDHWLKQAELVS